MFLFSMKLRLMGNIGIISKLKHYLHKDILKSIYYSLFNSRLTYGCQILGQGIKESKQDKQAPKESSKNSE